MTDFERIIRTYCDENELTLNVSSNMPQENENAFAVFEPLSKTLYFNPKTPSSACRCEQFFYLYQQLRHATQYLRPELFDNVIRQSRFYIINTEGICRRIVHNNCRTCMLVGKESYFRDVSLGQPHKMDANEYALKTVKTMLGDCAELEELKQQWTPKRTVSQMEYEILYNKIDEKAK